MIGEILVLMTWQRERVAGLWLTYSYCGCSYMGKPIVIVEGKNLQNMANLGEDLVQIGFSAFLKRTAALWPAVAALESRDSVLSAADHQARLVSKREFPRRAAA